LKKRRDEGGGENSNPTRERKVRKGWHAFTGTKIGQTNYEYYKGQMSEPIEKKRTAHKP